MDKIMSRLESAALSGDLDAEWTLDCVARYCRPGDAFRISISKHGVVRFVVRPSGADFGRCVARRYLAH